MDEPEILPAAARRPRPRPGPGTAVERTRSDERRVVATRSGRRGIFGLARSVTTGAVRTAGWAARGTAGTATGIARQLTSTDQFTGLVDHRVEAARTAAWRALGLVGAQGDDIEHPPPLPNGYKDLRAQGDALLQRSTDPDAQSASEHPAFSRILDEIAPDEARILRFMALAGPQPAIDIRTLTPFGVGSERLAGGINMIADMAGCAFPERNQQYLANLNRLGLVRFSAEQVDDPRRYSFIEAQPSASEAKARARNTVTVYRSIYLSLFGLQFCEVCFTLEGYDAGGWIRDVR